MSHPNIRKRWRRSPARAASLTAAAVMLAVATAIVSLIGAVPSATGAASSAPPQNVSPPTISGTAAQGQTLAAASGSWSGAVPITYAYQWLRCDAGGGSCANISGAGAQTYTAAAADVGSTLRVSVTATNSDGAATFPSAQTAAVASPGTAPSPTSQPTPAGTIQIGQTVTVPTGTWSGTTPLTFAYQWQRCVPNGACQSISGATQQTYAIVAADAGYALRAVVTATNSAGSGHVTSNLTSVVPAAGTPPANVGLPVVAGTPRIGQTLSVSSGTWTGTTPVTFSYQWRRCDAQGGSCADISGATAFTYSVTSADAGFTLRAAVTGRNQLGSGSAESAQTVVIAAAVAASGATVQVSALALPDRLVVDRVAFSPLHSRADVVTARFHVSDLQGRSVVGALVYALPIPYAWMTQAPETSTGSDGWASVQLRPTAQLPTRRGTPVVVFVRARKAGEDILAGISTRRLVQLVVR